MQQTSEHGPTAAPVFEASDVWPASSSPDHRSVELNAKQRTLAADRIALAHGCYSKNVELRYYYQRAGIGPTDGVPAVCGIHYPSSRQSRGLLYAFPALTVVIYTSCMCFLNAAPRWRCPACTQLLLP